MAIKVTEIVGNEFSAYNRRYVDFNHTLLNQVSSNASDS